MSKQLSIYSKLHHHSNKDMTISIGKNKTVNITFRNFSWLKFTDSEFVSIRVDHNGLTFGDGEKKAKTDRHKVYKLKKGGTQTAGHETTRYVNVTYGGYPDLYHFIERRGGDELSMSFNIESKPVTPPVKTLEPPVIQTPERVSPRTAETPNRVFMDGDPIELYNPPTNPLRVALSNMDKSSLVDLCLCLIKGGKDNV